MKRGIVLVANSKSQALCENLIFSIRQSGCQLPILLIHFGGKKIDSVYILNLVNYVTIDNFSNSAKEFIANLQTVLNCPTGFLYRFLGLFSEFDQFIYSDNDIVALSNWDNLFEYIDDNDLVHADEEYTTKGLFNHESPQAITELFGVGALEKAFTAGHFLINNRSHIKQDIENAIVWFKSNPNIPKKHDQALLHIAALLGNWQLLNLCKPPHNWLSSWAGDYDNSLALVQKIQKNQAKISHIHYSGSTPQGNMPIEDLLYSNLVKRNRLKKYQQVSFKELYYLFYLQRQWKRVKRIYKKIIS